ncbi:MAG: hypothetical protein LBQ24_00720 [Candidatus Peribacteria bacterium]|nr:hypothetical protein [Candidatus Peribacteria bacterium]
MSVTGIIASFTGTKLQICAIRIIKAFCLKNVDFHHIFGPVIMCTNFLFVSSKLLLINSRVFFEITGCFQEIIFKS